jgi:DNA-binding MarR family transcriptional regulator
MIITMPDANEETIGDLPPSCKLIYFVLRQEGPMTQRTLTDESMLPPRTVRYAIRRLEELSIITKRIHIKDARQNVYDTHVTTGGSGTNEHNSVTAADD